MTDSNWLIRNAELVSDGRRFQADLRIRKGRIERIDAGLSVQPGEQVIDAAGRRVTG